MKRHTKVMLVLAVLLAATSVLTNPQQARADGYSNGYVSAAGYTYRDGYWWNGNTAFERVRVKSAYTYWHCGRQYTGYRWSYSYKPVEVRKTVINLSEDGWRGKLLDIAKQRDQYEGKLRASALEHSEFLESIKVLGMEGNFRWNGYGYEMSYAQNPHAYGQQQYSQYPAQQGQTVYGYRELADIYGNVDLGALYNSVLRLREQSYGYESKATSETHALVGELGGQMARIKEIEAKGAAARAALEAASAKDRATLLREFWSTYPNRAAPSTTAPKGGTGGVGANEAFKTMQAIVKTKCAACHNSDKKNGGLDLSNLDALTDNQGKSILERIVHPDPTKRMPLKSDLSPGTPLTQQEIAAFYLAAYGSPAQQPAKKD